MITPTSKSSHIVSHSIAIGLVEPTTIGEPSGRGPETMQKVSRLPGVKNQESDLRDLLRSIYDKIFLFKWKFTMVIPTNKSLHVVSYSFAIGLVEPRTIGEPSGCRPETVQKGSRLPGVNKKNNWYSVKFYSTPHDAIRLLLSRNKVIHTESTDWCPSVIIQKGSESWLVGKSCPFQHYSSYYSRNSSNLM